MTYNKFYLMKASFVVITTTKGMELKRKDLHVMKIRSLVKLKA